MAVLPVSVPAAGTIKYRIPDAHSDYIFAVAGEEFGLVLCVIIAALFCLLTVRLLLRSAGVRDPFCQLAGAGLAVVITAGAPRSVWRPPAGSRRHEMRARTGLRQGRQRQAGLRGPAEKGVFMAGFHWFFTPMGYAVCGGGLLKASGSLTLCGGGPGRRNWFPGSRN